MKNKFNNVIHDSLVKNLEFYSEKIKWEIKILWKTVNNFEEPYCTTNECQITNDY